MIGRAFQFHSLSLNGSSAFAYAIQNPVDPTLSRTHRLLPYVFRHCLSVPIAEIVHDGSTAAYLAHIDADASALRAGFDSGLRHL